MRIAKGYVLFISLVVVALLSAAWLSHYSNRPRDYNIILITIDALRPDHLGCYGYKRNTSPNIDGLAQEGAMFTQAIAQSSQTPPAMTSVLTSAMPNKHLVMHWGDGRNMKLPTITKILRSQGFRNIFIGGHWALEKGLPGFSEDFDEFYSERLDAEAITSKIIDSLGRRDDNRPFFVWAHYMDVHEYEPTQSFYSLFMGDEWYNKQRELPITERIPRTYYGLRGIAEPLAERKGYMKNPDFYIAQYDGAIRTVDEEVGKLLKSLESSGLEENTIVIITSDHGEMLGERDLYFSHGVWLYEPLINIPLIIKCKNLIRSRIKISTQISAHLDIAATILGLLKLDIPGQMEGSDLLDMILHNKAYPRPYIFLEGRWGKRSIRGDNWKLIENIYDDKTEYELYNLKEDSPEQNNLADEEKTTFQFLKQKLAGYELTPQNSIKIQLDEQTRERLKSLGYL